MMGKHEGNSELTNAVHLMSSWNLLVVLLCHSWPEEGGRG